LTAALDLAVPRPIPSFVAPTGPPAAGRVCQATTPTMLVSRRHRRTGRWIGLSGQIAADLLPELGICGRSTAEKAFDLG
jgi:hypothetical protein